MNILLTSVGRRSYLVKYFKEAAGEGSRVTAVNSSAGTTAMAAADAAYQSPLIYDGGYIPFLLDICRRENIDILISLFDIDLPVLASAKPQFEELGVRVIVSDREFIDICNDKLKMCGFLDGIGLKYPYTSASAEDEYLHKLLDEGKSLIIKPRWGMGSLDIFEAENAEELKILYAKARRNLEKSYLRFEAGADMERAVIIQEKLDGREYGLDIINDLNGRYINTVIREKLAMRAGETDIAKMVYIEELWQTGKKVSGASGHIGNLDVDIIVNTDGAYIIDMNARFGGGYPFSHMAGVNLPAALIAWAEGREAENLTAEYGAVYAKDIDIVRIG